MGTYIAPDGHDEHHGEGEGLGELGVSTDLVETVAVVEDGGSSRAEGSVDLVAVGGDAFHVGSGDLDGLAVLDEDLVHSILFETSDDALRGGETHVNFCTGGETWGGEKEGTHVNFLVVSRRLP